METIFMDAKSSKTDESHKFVLGFSQRLHLKNFKICLFITLGKI